MLGFAPYMNQPAVHFTADPIARIAQHMNLAAAQLAADMSAPVARNNDLPRLHLRADPMHAAQIPFPLVNSIARVAAHRKKNPPGSTSRFLRTLPASQSP